MKEIPVRNRRNRGWVWLVAACGLMMLVAILLPRSRSNSDSKAPEVSTNGQGAQGWQTVSSGRRRAAAGPGPTAEETVATKVYQFTKNRREIVRAWARKMNLAVPQEVERFFDIVEAGKWEDIEVTFKSLRQLRQSEQQPEALSKIWPAVMETYGVVEVAHDWPAQKLLDYGQAVLGSLRPDMVYVGGTDPGRFIPTLLTETSGDRHVVLTQNALADNTYLDYVNFLHGDQLRTLTQADSQKGFQDYLMDARRRLLHDQNSPGEPKQIKPGEDVRLIDSRMQVSGQVAVMAINELLFQKIMESNPDASFAMEQSFPLKSTYGEASPLGPIMELRVRDEQNALTAERAGQAAAYWQDTARQLTTDPEAKDSSSVLMAYSKMAAEQAALLLDRKFPEQAERGFQAALEISPTNPEAVFRYIDMLMKQNRYDDAIAIAQNASQSAPNNGQFTDLLGRLKEVKK